MKESNIMINFYTDKEVDGIKGWHWIETDSGAWDGPKMDWETSHKLTIERFCKDCRTVVQAGGNQGMYPKLLSQMFDNVLTFEPDILNFQTLKLNCTENNIQAINSALGENEGLCVVKRLTMHNTGMHKVEVVHTLSHGTVPMHKLDSFTTLTDVDLIMLDLEGYESYALLGAANTIKKFRPVIFIERPSWEVRNFLGGFGYISVLQSAMDEVFVAP